MVKYIVSIIKGVLEPQNRYLTFLGEAVIPEHRHERDRAFHLGEEDGRLYYFCESGELEEVMDKLLVNSEEGVLIQKGGRENLPPKLREAYQKFSEWLKEP